MNNAVIRRALISVSNKAGLLAFAQQLSAYGIEIIATGGTIDFLAKNNVSAIPVADYTGFPEMMGGRVKTLHPKIYAGILQRPGMDDEILACHQYGPIDLVVVNLYPFQDTVTQPHTIEQAIEQIDIGGPTMLRAAAKNYALVTVVADPQDYPRIAEEIGHHGQTCLATRQYLAKKAFAHTAGYDYAIAAYFNQQLGVSGEFPEIFQPRYQKKTDLRYGENPHQPAVFYTELPHKPDTLSSAIVLQGKSLSYNNLLDSDAALNCVRSLDPSLPACVIIKHTTPCGVAQAKTLIAAYQQALATDPSSAFGGIIAVNCTVDSTTAQMMLNQYIEVLLAPEISPEARTLLSAKPSCRILQYSNTTYPKTLPSPTLHSIDGGLLLQAADIDETLPEQWRIVSQRQPNPSEISDLLFAWKVVGFVKSNAIVYAKNGATLGIGGGQTSRVFSAQIAVLKAQQAQLPLNGAVAASDAFLPFVDGLEVMAEAGIRAVIQPGGSKRDPEVIAVADQLNIAMVFTGIRHFRH